MNASQSPFAFLTFIALAALTPLTTPPLQAQLYWDTNGSQPGAGGASPSGFWNLQTATWNNALGDSTPQVWNNDGTQQAVFSAGTDATGAFVVALNAGSNLRLASLSLQAGSLTLSAATLADALEFDLLPATLHVETGATLEILSPLLGSAGLVKSGSGLLRLAAPAPAGPWNLQGGRLALGTSQSVGSLALGGDTLHAVVLELEDGIVLDLGGNLSLTNAGQTETTTLQGGTLHLNGDRSIVIPNAPAATDLEIGSVIADGSLPSSLTKSNNGGTLLLTANNTYTGATVLAGSNAGTLLVQGNEASIAGSSEVIIHGSVLTLGSLTDTARVNRLRDDAPLTLNGVTGAGAALNYQGPDEAEADTHVEVLGEIIVSGQHRSFLTLQPGFASELELHAAGLTRLDNGVLLLRGDQLGAIASTGDSSRLFLGRAPDLSGGVGAATGAGILPWAVGDTSATGAGTGFLTYDPQRGLRLLDPVAEFVAPELAATGANVRKASTGSFTLNLPNPVTVNSWTNAATGTITLASNLSLGINSGAMLFTANGTLSGGSIALAESRQGIIHLAANTAVTATLNSPLTGSHGLLLSGTGTGNKILVLGGDNRFTGGVIVYMGILQLNHAGALNSRGVNNLTVQAGGTLRLNGHSITVAGLDGAGALVNNHAANAAILTVHGGGTHTGAINNGNAAALGLVKTGAERLVLGGNNGYTGATRLLNGSLHVQPAGNNPGGNGGLRGTSEITLGKGTLLQVNNGNVAAANNANRVNDNAPLLLLGSLNYNHPAANLAYSETLGSLTLGRAAAQITTSSAGAAGTSALTFSSFAGRDTGGVVNFTGTSLGAADSALGRNQVIFLTGMPEGFMGGWATVGSEFAKYSPTTGISSLAASDSFTGSQDEWTATLHAKPDSAQTLDTDRDLLSLNLTGNGPKNLHLGGHLLNLHSGGLIKQGGSPGGTGATNVASISGGRLTAGGTVSSAELFLRVTGANLNISAAIIDNPGDGITPGSVALVKSGAGTVVLTGSNTFSGGLHLHEGVVVVNNSGSTGTGSLLVGPGARLGGNGTLGSLSPGAGIVVEKDGSLFVGQPTGLGAQTLTLQAENGFLISGSLELDLIGGGASGVLNPQTGNHDQLVFSSPQGSGLGTPILDGALLKLQSNLPITPDAWAEGSAWKLFDWYGLTSEFDNLPTSDSSQGNPLYLPNLSSLGLAWDWSRLYTDGTLAIVVPEPGRTLLLSLGLSLVLLRRSRSHANPPPP